MQRRALNCKGISVSAVFLLFGMIAAGIYSADPIKQNRFIMVFAILMLIHGFVRIILRKNILLVTTLFLLFFSMLIGYISPSFCQLELFFVPFILFDITVSGLCKWPETAPLLLLVSGLSSFMFPGFKSSFDIRAGNEIISVPVLAFTLAFFMICSTALIYISFLKNRNERIEADLRKAETHNTNLMKINSEISSKLFQIQQDSSEKERLRITKEVHDTAGYVFINVIMMLQAALAIIDKDYEKGKEKVDSALEYTRRGMNEIRMTLHEMRAYEKPNIGIQNELYNIVAVFRQATDIKVTLEYGNWPNHFNKKETELFLVSFVQECLTNTVKHGNANTIDIFCWKDKEAYTILIQDNGKTRQKNLVLGIGLSGIEDFVSNHDGKVSYGYNQTGFIVSVKLPLSS